MYKAMSTRRLLCCAVSMCIAVLISFRTSRAFAQVDDIFMTEATPSAAQQKIDAESVQAAQLTPSPTPQPIVKHFRFDEGKEPVPGPTPTPLVNIDAFVEEFKQQWIAAMNNMPTADEVVNDAIGNSVAPQLSRCLEDKTESLQVPSDVPEGLQGDKSPFQDVLFVDMKDFVEDADLVYGPTTILVPFVKDVPNVGWSYIQELGVPCLPFRMRLQQGRMFRDQGLPALKNYSTHPKGEYHPYIKSLYKLEKSR